MLFEEVSPAKNQAPFPTADFTVTAG